MSDSETKPKIGVPSWQRQKGAEEETKTEEQVETKVTEEPSRTELVESAKKFLEEDEVKDATTDKKIAFLESKGLKNEEIEQLLGVARNVEASNPAPKPMTRTVIPTQQSILQQGATTTLQAAPPQPQAAPQPYRDTPPIITYPEFLTTPQAPPPLITPTRILNTLYAFSGLGALIYGASTYLVKPMSDNLAIARHELAETAQEKLNTLNEKLKPLVSELPQPNLAHGEVYKDRDDYDFDDDPTEMFHRDIGVQTSDELETLPIPDIKPEAVNTQTSKSGLISVNLSEIDLAISSESHGDGQIQKEINSLKTYLDTLMYTPPSFTYGSGVAFGAAKKDEDDQIGAVKREIRAVKGVLLSTKNFPAASAQYKRPGVQA